jgi:H+-transporting ATPase
VVGDTYTCGDYVGWSELMTVIYLALSVGGQLTVFVSRTRHSFWSRRPGYALLVACIGAQICATLISVYLPYSFKIDSYVGITDQSSGGFTSIEVVMNGIDWKMAGFVWAYSAVMFVVSDFAKVYFYYSMDNDNAPEDDVIGIKKQKKMFLPAIGQPEKKRKTTNASRH